MFCKSLVKYDVSNQRSLKLLSQSHFISSPKFRIFSYGTFHSIKSYAEIENGCQFPKISREEWESILRYFRKKARRKFLIGNFSSILPYFPLEFPELWFAFQKFNILRVFWKSPQEIPLPVISVSKVSEFVFEYIWKVLIASIWKRSRR